jgi:hypothetical protein
LGEQLAAQEVDLVACDAVDVLGPEALAGAPTAFGSPPPPRSCA